MQQAASEENVTEIVSTAISAARRMAAEVASGPAFDVEPEGPLEINLVDGRPMKCGRACLIQGTNRRRFHVKRP